MPYTVPTIQDSANQNLTVFEGAVGQKTPLSNKAFLRVLSVVEALAMTGLYKYAAERAQQVLAMTAGEDGLTELGAEYDVPRKAAVAARVVATLPATSLVVIPQNTAFIGSLNGVTYTVDNAIISYFGVAELTLTAQTAGVVGNLAAGAELNIVSGVPGADTVATVTELVITGAEQETLDDWAARILFAERATQGGGNGTDYRMWAEAVGGVVRAYPYSGKPASVQDTSYPGDRTIYVEADSTVNVDGVPSSDLLAEVRAALNINPETGLSRPTLGLTDQTLYVLPISRTIFSVNILGLTVPSGTTAAVRDAISSALGTFFVALRPYVLGVDLPQDQNDTVTVPLVNQIVQDVLTATGSSASGVLLLANGTPVSTYRLSPGELAKLGQVEYDGAVPVTTTTTPGPGTSTTSTTSTTTTTTTGAPGTPPVSTIQFTNFS